MKETLELPPMCQGAAWCYSRRSYPRHRHAELEANLIMRGRARYLVDVRRYDLAPGGLVLLFPGQEHVLLDATPDFAMWVLLWRPGLIRRTCTLPANGVLRQRSPEGSFYRALATADVRPLDGLCRRIARLQGMDGASDRVNALLGVLLLELWSVFRAADQPAPRHVHPAVEKAAQMIRHGAAGLSLAQLAAAAGLSPSRLSRLFRQQTGVPLVRFRQKQLLERFFAIYGDGSRLTLMHAALRAGFGSYPQFHRVFKALTGKGPSAYFLGV